MHYVIDLQIEPDAKGLDPYGKPWAPLATSTLYRAIEAKEQSITRIGNKKRGASSTSRHAANLNPPAQACGLARAGAEAVAAGHRVVLPVAQATPLRGDGIGAVGL